MKAIVPFLGLAGAVTAQHLQSRSGQLPAVCQQQFAWMGSQNGASPCQTVANVDAQCNNGNWLIAALNSSVHYDPPSGAFATFCTCSWASYNLLSACTACQGFPEQIPSWGDYSAGCAGHLTTDSFFPTNITLPSTIGIPFWAQTNPTTWPATKFDPNQAQQIAAESHPDFVGGTPTPTVGETKKKSNTGAIAGGVVGGLVVIGAAVAIALWMIRRSRKPPAGAQQLHTGSELLRPSHMRSMSDISTFKAPEGLNYHNISGGTLNGRGGGLMPPTSPIQTHFTGSTHSVPYMSTVFGGASTAPYGTTASSPPPVPRAPTPGSGSSARIEDIVVPFTAPPTLDANMDRKNPNGAFPVTMYSDPNAPHPNTTPMRMEITRPHTPVGRPTQRFNPPSYEASSPAGESSSGRHGHSHNRSKQGSTDTNHSMTSSRTGVPGQTPSHSPNTSISMPGIAGQMSTLPGVREVASPTTPAQALHGRKVSASTRDVKARPGDDAFSARDIA